MRFRLIAWTFLAAIAATGMDEGENVTVDVWIHDDVSPAKLLSFNKDLVSGIFQKHRDYGRLAYGNARSD